MNTCSTQKSDTQLGHQGRTAQPIASTAEVSLFGLGAVLLNSIQGQWCMHQWPWMRWRDPMRKRSACSHEPVKSFWLHSWMLLFNWIGLRILWIRLRLARFDYYLPCSRQDIWWTLSRALAVQRGERYGSICQHCCLPHWLEGLPLHGWSEWPSVYANHGGLPKLVGLGESVWIQSLDCIERLGDSSQFAVTCYC